MEKLMKVIWEKVRTSVDLQAYADLRDTAREALKTNVPLGIKYLTMLSDRIQEVIVTVKEVEKMRSLYTLHRSVLLAGAQHSFDMYLQFVEFNREPRKKFYFPRRPVLKQVVDALQDLSDDKLDILGISMPPGTGKTTLAIFYLTWLAGKYPDAPILTGSHSNSFVRGTYDECLRIFDPQGEYLWHEVFTGVQVSNTNAKDCRIDLGSRKRFETLEFTSIGTGNAGLYRAATLLYCDDLVSGIEVALSRERLDKLWETYNTDLRQRKIGDKCKELHIATRWSVHDVIGRLADTYSTDPRAKFITLSALDENDESNFNYPYGVGFTTKFYHEQRDIMDDVNWKALYMNEPVERLGVLYDGKELRRYFDLPDREPDAILSVCDTKDRGSDYCVMPIAYQYGDDYFIEEILCDNSNPDIVDARLIEILLRHRVQRSCFESNSAGGRVAQTVQQGVKDRGGITKIETKFNTKNKETRIVVSSPFVKEHFLFKDESQYSREYRQAMTMICSYTTAGRNKHDDTVDALAQLAEYVENFRGAKVEVFKRPW